jgi:alpha-L-fucosidase 2
MPSFLTLLFLIVETAYNRMNTTIGIINFKILVCYDGFIYLLPALPTIWKAGSIKGIIARGGFELDLSWKNGKVSRLVVKSHKGGNCRLRSLNPLTGNGLKRAKGENPNDS